MYKTLTMLGAVTDRKMYKVRIITTEGKNITYRRPSAHNFYTWNRAKALPLLPARAHTT